MPMTFLARRSIACLALLAAAAGSPRAEPRPNRLIHEKSPYLLQHAYNPVDWFPWGEEAFSKARREHKPIFLSIGYATCHWCHVMESESYADPKIGALLNKSFVSIKVDREERPDVDSLYMSAAAAGGWGGGWPLNVFLTPDRETFFGGTYFPPEPRSGQPGFADVLRGVAQSWKKDSKAVTADAKRAAQALREQLESRAAKTSKLDARWLDAALASFENDFDAEHGGFDGAPKFPMPADQDFLLRAYARTGNKKALDMTVRTLRAIAAGGIDDQLGGGFHRYSTDDRWRVPHFEKMLYDNAQLAVNFLEAYQATKDPEFARAARETLDYVLAEMTSPDGAFFSAEDADSLPPGAPAGAEKKEGAFYLWTAAEFDAAAGPSAALARERYGVAAAGENILYAARSAEELAARSGRTVDAVRADLDGARRRLLEARAKRPRPARDDKVLASWNGLMISALAQGAQVLGEPRYASAAERAARFLRAKLYDEKSQTLRHRWRDGEAAIPGMAADYAFLTEGLIDLYETTFDPAWLEWALDLARTQDRLFLAKEGGLYTTAAGDPALLVRSIEENDGAEPSASSVAALNGLRLDQYTTRPEAFRSSAQRTLERFGERMDRAPRSLPRMLVALDFALSKPRQIVIAGKPGASDSEALLKALRERFIPVKTVVFVDDGPLKARLLPLLPFLESVVPIRGKATAYVCVDRVCRLPTSDVVEFERLLDAQRY